MITSIEAAFNARLATQGLRVLWEGRTIDLADRKTYIAAQIAGLQRQPMGIGPKVSHLWTGVLSLLVVANTSVGVPAARGLAVPLMTLFERGTTLVHGAAKVVIERADMAPCFSAADTITVPVRITWFCEEPPA